MRISRFQKRHPPVGARPGTVVVEAGGQAPDVRVLDYTTEAAAEHDHVPAARLRAAHDRNAPAFATTTTGAPRRCARSRADPTCA